MKPSATLVLALTLTFFATFDPSAIEPADQKTKRIVPIRRLPGYEEKKKEAEAQREAIESGQLAPLSEEAAIQPTRLAPTLLTGFAGMDFTDGGGSVPPDTIAATGPNHIVEVVNSTVAILNRTTGVNLFQRPLSTFFSSVNVSDCIFDPVVAYDELAQRFYIGALDVPEVCSLSPAGTAQLLYAVSDTSDPTAGFTHMYAIDVDETSNSGCGLSTSVGGDFTRTGWNADAHVFTFNMFDFPGTCYDHVAVITIDKSTIDTGTLGFTHADRNGFTNFSLVPARMHGAVGGDPMWLVEEANAANTIRVVKMESLLTAPTFTETNISVAAYGNTPNANQKGGGFSIDAGDTRILHVEWRDDRLAASQTVGLSGTARARWYEFDTSGTPTLTQQGTINPGSGIHTYYPSIAIAENGDLGMTFMQSSSAEFMSMYVSGQSAGDAPGTMQTPVLAKAGLRNYTAFDCTSADGCRAGDYSGITIDPNFTDRFCAANEYATSAGSENWGTWIACFTLTAPHDLAVIALSVPKKVSGTTPVTGAVGVTIQNRSDHNETISSPDLGDGTASGVARLAVSVDDSGGEGCVAAIVNLDTLKNAKLFAKGPKVLKPKGTLTVNYLVTYQCSIAHPKTDLAGDYSHTATVHHEALSGAIGDTHPEDDMCPRAPLPGGIDPNPAPKGVKDTGCGPKGAPGAPIVVNVVL